MNGFQSGGLIGLALGVIAGTSFGLAWKDHHQPVEPVQVRKLPEEWDWPTGTPAMLARSSEEAHEAASFLGKRDGIIVLVANGPPGTVLGYRNGGQFVFKNASIQIMDDYPPSFLGNIRVSPDSATEGE